MFAANPLATKSSMTNQFFKSRILVAALAFLAMTGLASSANASSRTLNLKFPHSGESIVITYKKDGRYIPSAMKKLNWFFRDWRAKKPTNMDPRTIDLLWELYTDLGAKKPAHIVSGYRSPHTNAMLRRIGRKVARHSQHMLGKAIDVYFPDVPTSRLRGSALARRVGGVGYYPRSGSYGFVHIDSGSVRHWPRMSQSRLASVINTYRGTIGARFKRPASKSTRYASTKFTGPRNILPSKVTVTASNDRTMSKPAVMPLPRPRPLAVAMAAAAAEQYIVPVSAPLEKRNFGSRPAMARDGIGSMLRANGYGDNPLQPVQRTNRAAKGSFVTDIRNGRASQVPMLRPMQASASGQYRWSGNIDAQIRRDGAPGTFTAEVQLPVATPKALSRKDRSILESMIAAITGKKRVEPAKAPSRVVRKAKADRLIVNRAAKGDMVTTRPALRVKNPSKKQTNKDLMASSFEAILKSAERPISFVE